MWKHILRFHSLRSTAAVHGTFSFLMTCSAKLCLIHAGSTWLATILLDEFACSTISVPFLWKSTTSHWNVSSSNWFATSFTQFWKDNFCDESLCTGLYFSSVHQIQMIKNHTFTNTIKDGNYDHMFLYPCCLVYCLDDMPQIKIVWEDPQNTGLIKIEPSYVLKRCQCTLEQGWHCVRNVLSSRFVQSSYRLWAYLLCRLLEINTLELA